MHFFTAPVLTTGADFVIIHRCEKYEKCDLGGMTCP